MSRPPDPLVVGRDLAGGVEEPFALGHRVAMLRYQGVVLRLLGAAGTLLSVVAITFLLIHLAPGDPVTALVGEYGGASPEVMVDLRARFGLDRPLGIQFGLYVWNVLHGNLGRSFRFEMPVLHLVFDRLPATLILMGISISLFTMIGITIGIYSATHADSVTDNIVRALVVIGYSVPVFWLGQILIYVFAVRLSLFPVLGIASFQTAPGFFPKMLDVLWHLVLPATALGAWNLATTQRFMRTSLLQVLHEDYIRTAMAKGVPWRRVIFRHALRNALLPVVTMTGLSFATMLTGAALTETVFGWPGLGRLMFEAIGARDRPVLLGLLLVSAAMAIAVDAVTDLAYGALDPRLQSTI